MNDDMKLGYLIALQGVNEKIKTIVIELDRKGLTASKEMGILVGYIQDRIVEIIGEDL